MSLKDWKNENNTICKEFIFDHWHILERFVIFVMNLATKLNHHPNIIISYGKVQIVLTTHDEGGVTALDLEMANKIEAYLEEREHNSQRTVEDEDLPF